MASRRLDISSLLCDEQIPDPVILAPHLKQPSSSSSSVLSHHAQPPAKSSTFPASSHMYHASSSPHHRLSPSHIPYPLPSQTVLSSSHFTSPMAMAPPKPQTFGLDALVQVATEERRRLSTNGPPELDILRGPTSPNEQRHMHFPHQPSFRQHTHPEEHVRSPVLHRSPNLSPVQSVKSPSQSMLSPAQLIRSPVYSQHHSHPLRPSQEKFRDELQGRLSTVEDGHHVSSQSPSPYFSPPLQIHPPRLYEHQAQQQQRDRQRMHHEQLLLQEEHHRQQQKYAREHPAMYPERQLRTPSMPLHVDPPSSSQLSFSHPQTLARPPSMNHVHSTGRKSDPGHPPQRLHNPMTLSPHAFSQSAPNDESPLYPSKKRRYSDSPGHQFENEQEKMPVADLSHIRPESNGPRRPGSGYTQGRKHLGLLELVTTDQTSHHVLHGGASVHPEGQMPAVSKVGANLREDISVGSQEIAVHEAMRDGHRQGGRHDMLQWHSRQRKGDPQERSPPILSPPQRGPPFGHQSRTETIPKKAEEEDQSLHELLAQTIDPTSYAERNTESQEQGAKTVTQQKTLPNFPVVSGKDLKPTSEKQALPVILEKENKKRLPPRASLSLAKVEPVPPKKHRTSVAHGTQKATEEDAHEWFLEHFDDFNGRSLTPHAPTPLVSAPASGHRLYGTKASVSTSANIPETADDLEHELEELLGDSTHKSKAETERDMDVDLVTELVVETLGAEGTKVKEVAMEVDVEDELLSLLDDHPTLRRPSKKADTVDSPEANTTPPMPMGTDSKGRVSPAASSTVPTSPSTVLHQLLGQGPTNLPASDRGSMPPPVIPVRGQAKEEGLAERIDGSAAPPKKKKKKDTVSKPNAKVKTSATVSTGTATAKSRAKAGPKAKGKSSDASLPSTAAKSKSAGAKKAAVSRSRSTSVMPSATEGSEPKAEKQEEEEESDEDDEKLYCVCKTVYDEDRFMIACDRCDDWYHTQCVDMPDLEVDLVDQFICPLCMEKNPHLNLKTTYKARCLNGLRYSDPSSAKACHRPARGALSKYCSEECGLKYMQMRVDVWAKKGGAKEKLWETVKDAEKREGVVVCALKPLDAEVDIKQENKSKTEREIGRLNGLLDSVVRLREDIKKEMESVLWREKLLELATARAEETDDCGWDQRLCYGDDQCVELGEEALESYNAQNGISTTDSIWWCSGNKACDRHAGWQAMRIKDVCKEKEKKNDALSNLTMRERDLRKRMEDILDPHGRNCNDSADKSSLKVSATKSSNGHVKGKTNGDTTAKKGKKRKAAS
ncbi:hypothetical protein H0H93_012518 [Arthromyces matolae]|nr:hypothetical protein H0H93_012518 [Arthromyces matolae]